MIGTQLGPYEITGKLGEGGMGEVYRATDSKLKREVAIKVLPKAFTEDPERLARFEREAQLLAQLQHPNIASIYGLEDSDGVRALVMELVEGPTLAERLESGPLPIDESLEIARQIAEALEEAHEKGIIHRDLKPQNIKAARDGKVKVLDFGLAKAMDPSAGSTSVADLAHSPTMLNSPTLTAVHGTQLGVILGTAAYMAPEQARGAAVDKRADIWAFGVVLYEMLVGASLFAADTVSDTLAGVLKTEIDVARLPEETPAAIRRLLRRCLDRDPKNRLHDIADARIVIDEVLKGELEVEPTPVATLGSRRFAHWALAGIALAIGLGLGFLLGRAGETPVLPLESASFRGQFKVSPPDATNLVSGLAISVDGSQLAFTASGVDGRTRLWVHSLGSGEQAELPGTLDARYPFWSPDGRRLGFFSQNRLKVTDLLGGSTRTIAETGTTEDARGATWNSGDRILFTPTFTGPIFSVSAEGGEVVPATSISSGSGVGTQRFPTFLPDGERFVFYASGGTGIEPGTLYLGRLGSLESKPLGPASSAAAYAEPGYLVFVHGDSLVARPFDLEKEEFAGQPVPLGVSLAGSVAVSGQRSLAVSASGILVYREDKRSATELVWVDREGKELETLATDETDTWNYAPTLSPDGRFLASSRYEPGSTSGDIWVQDLERDFGTRMTFDGQSDDTLALFSPDGSELAFARAHSDSGHGIYRVDSKQPGAPQPWVTSEFFVAPVVWLPGDAGMIYMAYEASGRSSLFLRGLGEHAEPRRLGSERVAEMSADLSPDGRWLAFQSDPSRRMEVYLRRLDDATRDSTLRVSLQGGRTPRWRRDGRELFYIDDSDRLMSVPITSLDPPTWDPPAPLFDARLERAGDRQYDVAPDGQRFILNRSLVADRNPITVVIDWQQRLHLGETP